MKDLQTPVSHDLSPRWCAADIQSHSAPFPGGNINFAQNFTSTGASACCHHPLTVSTQTPAFQSARPDHAQQRQPRKPCAQF
ncbi:hypothetical protein [Ferribacterium limneticum]|uniref:hypothetical protein n=1 Tax=Ferribacterium limneticum TaxID=76259 RepID=UPI001CFBB01A|nr:hypothetical protein [Ferribacterium limneticum]UCV30126.1 hypothetical protein KI617_08650 [Ferribacterium limneticum]UCV34045.1 hypothetical protein KI608_08650 [Ferribacterium limneticum]